MKKAFLYKMKGAVAFTLAMSMFCPQVFAREALSAEEQGVQAAPVVELTEEEKREKKLQKLAVIYGQVDDELHIAGTGSFCTCSGNLLGNICCSKNHFCIGNTVIFNKYNLNFTIYGSIIVNHICNRVDKLDCQLGISITCCRFCPENKGSFVKIHLRVFL